MRFAFSSNAFLSFNLLDTIDILAGIGYEGIEIMADAPHAFPRHLSDRDSREIRAAIEAKGLTISNINAFMHHADGDTYHPSWIEDDLSMRNKRIDYTLRCIDLAEKLGARSLSTEPGGPLLGMSADRGMQLFMQGLAAVEKKAREKGVRILIEPEPHLLIENSEQFMKLFHQLDPEVFGLNFDIGHFFCVGEDPALLVGQMRGIAHHYHLEDIAETREHYHLMLGKGAIDIPGVLDLIEKTGYTGFVTVELYTYVDKAEAAAREAFEYLKRWREEGVLAP
jgi:sugar phosphate isomerase/epimerase